MKKYIHAGCVGLFIIYFISSFSLFAPTASAMMMWVPPCCSSILFIPGLEGSRLYKSGFLSENQLWEPNRNADVEKLYLDTSGESVDQSIYTRDIIKSTNYPAFNIDVYRSFSDSMDVLVSGGTINEWRALPYDWRLDYNDIITNGIKTSANATTSVIQIIQDLANGSKTGQVTIVTHSNGGLLAKAIIDELNNERKSNLIDKLILVAVPQLGTPQSIPAILHGYGQDIFNGIILNSSVARKLAENMPTAYNLLPSEKYINQNTEPLVTFDPSIDSISNFRKIYGDSISGGAVLNNFLLGVTDGRAKPNFSDVSIPNILNSALLTDAENVHQILDNWMPPSNIAVSQIVGWGLDTVDSVEYKKKTITVCTPICYDKDVLDYQPLFDFHGDGTVIKSSADALSVPTYYVNMAGVNVEHNSNRSHTDMLETDEVQTLIKNIINDQQSSLSGNVTTSLPPVNNQNSLQISVHSPVLINLYDASGNHTGPVGNPDQSSDLTFYEANIPNSYYLPFGEGVYTGINNPGVTTVSLQGAGVGSFTLELDRVSGTSTVQTVFENVPVLPTTVASLISSATTSLLAVDLDGDGKVEMKIAPGNAPQNFDPIVYLQTMESVIAGFNLNKKVENQLDKKIENLITLIKKGKINKVDKKIQTYLKSAKLTKKHRKIDTDDQNTIVTMLNNLLDNIK